MESVVRITRNRLVRARNLEAAAALMVNVVQAFSRVGLVARINMVIVGFK